MPDALRPEPEIGDLEPKDSGALLPDQLSEHELRIILEIERRLELAKGAQTDEIQRGPGRYLKTVRDQHARVLLLDGGRGTGKTSLLLTLVQRWHNYILNTRKDAREIEEAYAARVERLGERLRRWFKEVYGVEIGGLGLPRNIRVLDVLDFDPLPPGMPLIAGIMQAWRPLAEAFDQRVAQRADYDEDERGGLLDQWFRLFHMAASGWGTVSDKRGLLEQVLDRQDQVENWQHLGDDWRAFVDEVLKRGLSLREEEQLGTDTVFVVMVDDCDLQVGRVRQLLPALRMLYHPRVFFLVAADQRHMLDMLQLDFYGQQQAVAHHQNANPTALLDLTHADLWAPRLSQASFDKVFPKANRWELKRLSLLDFLAFPRRAEDLPITLALPSAEGPPLDAQPVTGTLFELLNQLSSKDGKHQAGDLILKLARASDQELPGVMSYRSAHQLLHHAERFSGSERAAQILLRLVNQAGDDQQATVRPDATGSSITVEVRTSGELAVLYPPGPQILGTMFNVYFGTRPDFLFIGRSELERHVMSIESGHRFNFTGALIAKMLDEAKFSIDTGSLAWNTYTSHAWTEWSLEPHMTFRWTPHEHPRPEQLLKQTAEWRSFVATMTETDELRDERSLAQYAYAWIYYQRKWTEEIQDPPWKAPNTLGDRPPEDWPWDQLLDFSSLSEKEQKRWIYETLPLLARPEIGFPTLIQRRFLNAEDKTKNIFPLARAPRIVRRGLKQDRHRYITNAIIAARFQHGNYDTRSISDSIVNTLMNQIDEAYIEAYGKPNHWKDIVDAPEQKATKPRATRSTRGKPPSATS